GRGWRALDLLTTFECTRAARPLAMPGIRAYHRGVTTSALLTLGILAAAIALLLSGRIRADLIALTVLIALGLTGVVPAPDVFSGFSRTAVITIMAIFILTNGLYRTGVTHWMGNRLLQLSGTHPVRLTIVVMLAGAILSWFMNTIAAGAVLLPAVIGLSRTANIRPSKLLMPLSFGTLLGGMATLLTTANILVSAGLRDAGYAPFRLLDFLPAGGITALTGIIFMATIGRRLLPNRSPSDRYLWAEHLHSALSDLYNLRERLCEARVEPSSPLVGKSIAESRIGEALGLSILAVERNGHIRLAPKPDDRLKANDVLMVVGRNERVLQLARLGATVGLDAAWDSDFVSDKVGLVEVLIAPRSRVVGQTLKQIHFREKIGLTVIALWRGGRPYRTDVGDMPLQFGDALLMHGPNAKIQLLQAEPDFIVLQPEAVESQRPQKGLLAALIMLAALAATAIGWLPIAEATFTGAVLMILTGCVTIDEAYQAIEWRAVFLIAGILPLGTALQKTGAAAYIGQVLIQGLGGWGPLALLAGVYLFATMLTQFVSGQAGAVIAAPVAISAAAQIGANPHAFAMAAALACSTAFLTPIAHPINLLIMGPAGYTPRDYVRVGLPLTLLCFVTAIVAIGIFWSL
ncbi:MAG TPA: SLC13 family permease, partial [Anaerolineae bacterium]